MVMWILQNGHVYLHNGQVDFAEWNVDLHTGHVDLAKWSCKFGRMVL
jgi:hypothetical protein